MSKEEILEKCMSESPMETGSETVCLEAMSEYAEKVAVAFAEWKDKEGWRRDYQEQSTHSYLDHYQYFINNVYNQ